MTLHLSNYLHCYYISRFLLSRESDGPNTKETNHQTRASADVQHEYFRTEPYPCPRSELPKHEPSHEWVMKKRRMDNGREPRPRHDHPVSAPRPARYEYEAPAVSHGCCSVCLACGLGLCVLLHWVQFALF